MISRRIQNPWDSLFIHQRAPRPAAVRVYPVLFCFQRQRHILPMHHVAAHQMRPPPPNCAWSIRLMEDVGTAVGIKGAAVDPLLPPLSMVARTVDIFFKNIPVKLGALHADSLLFPMELSHPLFRKPSVLNERFLKLAVKDSDPHTAHCTVLMSSYRCLFSPGQSIFA